VDPTGVKPPRLLVPAGVIPVPEGFDFDPDTNDLIIPDLGTGKILRVNPDSGQISTVAEKLDAPIALVIGADKKIYVPSLTGVVYRVDLDGKNLETIAKLPPGLDNTAITKDGRLFVTSYWDATIFEVATDGSGKFKQLFPQGPNQPLGIVVKGDKVLVADAIMVRTVSGGNYHQTNLNAWAAHGMPLPLSLTNGPGSQVFWTDCINNAVAIGDPATGEFKPVAGGLNRPMSALMSKSGTELYVAEYAGGQITVVNLKDGSKSILAKDLEGPISMAVIDGTLYVGEAKPGRVSEIDISSGKKEVFISSGAGKPLALANDGAGNLLVLDATGHKLIRATPKTLAIKDIAVNLPVDYATVGSYPSIEFPLPMFVSTKGDIYLTTAKRGVLKLEKGKK
jgi:sugar lactone lactonase YvrE